MNVDNLLRSIPLEELDEVWGRRVRHEGADRRAQWMAAADALRDQPGEPLARAQAVYWALREDLDTAELVDADRVIAVLLSGVSREQAFEEFARRAVERGAGDVALMGRIASAQCASTRGDQETAEQELLGVLASTRGREDWLEHKIAASLSKVFVAMGQEFEGLVFAHHAVKTLGPDADPWARLSAHQGLCQTLRLVQDPDGLRIALDRFEIAIDGAASPWTDGAARYLHGVRAEQAFDFGQLTLARGELARMRATGSPLAVPPGTTSWADFIEAHILRALGQPGDALDLLPREGLTRDLMAGLLAAECAFDLEEHGLALEHGRGVLAVLESGDDSLAKRGTGRHVKLAASLGEMFHKHAEDEDIGQRAFDEAARSTLLRLLELKHCRKRLPEVALLTSDHLEILKGYHRRFVAQHAVFLDRLVPFLEEQLRSGCSPLDDLLRRDDFLLLCGWCHRVRDREGAWLPIGHFLPERSSLQVTHGICPTCRTAVDRDTIDA